MKQTRRTDAEVMEILRDYSGKLNRARAMFAHYCAEIENSYGQRMPVGPIETKRIELEAVEEIVSIMNGIK